MFHLVVVVVVAVVISGVFSLSPSCCSSSNESFRYKRSLRRSEASRGYPAAWSKPLSEEFHFLAMTGCFLGLRWICQPAVARAKNPCFFGSSANGFCYYLSRFLLHKNIKTQKELSHLLSHRSHGPIA